MALPHAPALRRLSILTSALPKLSDYAAIPLASTPSLVRHIPRELLHELARTPLLSTILFLYLEDPIPYIGDIDYIEPDYFVPSINWERLGHRGAIIREYESPRSFEDTQVLWHIRTLSRNTGEGIERMWG